MLSSKKCGLFAVALLLIAMPAFAEQDAAPPKAPTMPVAAPPTPPPAPMMMAPTIADQIEERLAALKVGLKITSKQASLWDDFSKVALANAQAIVDLNKEGAMGMSNVPDELVSKEKGLKVHSDNIKKLKAVLDPLYKSFSDEQKRVADQRIMMELSAAM